jgi:uncharacterized protein YjbI with pentapeptide repeats
MRLPDDPTARQVLQEYLENFEGDRMPWVLQAKDLDFRGAVLDGVNLQSAALHGACLDGVSLRNADLDAARLWSASLREADLTGAEIVKAQFYGADATGATFDDLVYAARAEFDHASLREATFRRCQLTSVSFLGANLTRADFTNAILLRTSFLEARLHRASFQGASGTIRDSGAYVEEGADAPLLPAGDVARWMTTHGATEVTVFISPLASLIERLPPKGSGPSASPGPTA